MSAGMAVGASGAFWAKRKAEETVERYMPAQISERATTGAKDFGNRLKLAAQEGRQSMKDKEFELREMRDKKRLGTRSKAS